MQASSGRRERSRVPSRLRLMLISGMVLAMTYLIPADNIEPSENCKTWLP